MTVRALLETWEDQDTTDVVISDYIYNQETDSWSDEIVALWNVKDHNHWYYGQLNYFTTIDTNNLEPYFGREVRSFYAINTVEIDKYPILYITVK